jgi:multiple sugar transport system substrate-binding protein
MERIVDSFNAAHRDIRVHMQIIPWGTFYDKVTLGLAFGGAPDVFVLHASRVPEYASHGALAPLEGRPGLKQIEADIVPSVRKSGVWQGTRFSLPLDCHPVGLYYNVDLFRRAGIDHPPVDEQEFVQDAHRLTVKGPNGSVKQWGFVITDTHLVGSTVFSQFGGGVLNGRLDRSAMDTVASRDAVGLMLSWLADGGICPKPDPAGAWFEFQTGRAAMAMQGIWMIDSLEHQKDLNYAAAPVPRFGPGRAVWANSHTLNMPAGLPEDRKAAAWTFMRYLSDHSLDWARAGQVPIRSSILNSPGFRMLRVQREFAKELPYVAYEPFSPVINQVAGFADTAVEATLGGVQAPDDALRQAARRVDRVLELQQ